MNCMNRGRLGLVVVATALLAVACESPVIESGADGDAVGGNDGTSVDARMDDAPRADCDGAQSLVVSVEVAPPVLPGGSVGVTVMHNGAVSPVVFAFTGGTTPDGDRPAWVTDPVEVAAGQFEVPMVESATLDWSVSVSDACAEASATFRTVAGYPRIAFVHASPDAGDVRFGGPSGPNRFSLTVVEVDGDGASVARNTDALKFGEAGAAFDWTAGVARLGVYTADGTEPFATIESEVLMPTRVHVAVLHDGADGPALALATLPADVATPSLLLNAIPWADGLAFRNGAGPLAAPIAPGIVSVPFAVDWAQPVLAAATGASGLVYDVVLADAVAYPASPGGGVGVDAGRFVKPDDSTLFIGHVGADGGMGLLVVGYETSGGAWSLQLRPLPQYPLSSEPAALLVNQLAVAAQLRDDVGRPVGPVVPAGLGASAFERIANDASAWVLATDAVEHAVPEGMLSTAAGARHLVTAWPTEDGGVQFHMCRATGAGAPASAGRLDVVIASPQPATLGVGLGVEGRGGFPVAPDTVSMATAFDADPWIATVTSMGEQRLLSISPQATFGGVQGRVVVLMPPGTFGAPPVVALLRGGVAGGGFELASPMPFAWTRLYAIDISGDGGGQAVRTAAPFPSATGWIGYGPDESGVGGASYRVLRLTGAPFFEVVLTFDVGTNGNACADSLVVRRETGGGGYEAVDIGGSVCGREQERTFVVPEGVLTVGVASNRIGHTNDPREGGPWSGWRVRAVTPRFEP
jgi:hypothetical protein